MGVYWTLSKYYLLGVSDRSPQDNLSYFHIWIMRSELIQTLEPNFKR